MELLAGAAAAAWGGGELFSYNRENYMFDKEFHSIWLHSNVTPIHFIQLFTSSKGKRMMTTSGDSNLVTNENQESRAHTSHDSNGLWGAPDQARLPSSKDARKASRAIPLLGLIYKMYINLQWGQLPFADGDKLTLLLENGNNDGIGLQF